MIYGITLRKRLRFVMPFLHIGSQKLPAHVLAFTIALTSQVNAQDIEIANEAVPAEARGIWSDGSCDAPTMSLLVTSKFMLVLRDSPSGEAQVALGPVSMSGKVVKIKLEQVEMPLADIGSLNRCDTLPQEAYLIFGETIAVLSALDDLTGVCQAGAVPACMHQAFVLLDVSSDRKLSVAEIARAVRAIVPLATYDPKLEEIIAEPREVTLSDIFVPASSFSAATLATIAIGPVLIASVLNSFDYDGDGFLDEEEIAQDRMHLLGTTGVGAGDSAAPALKSTAAAAAEQISDTAQKLMIGIMGLTPQTP